MNGNIWRTSFLVPVAAVIVLLTRLDDAATLMAPGGQGAASGMAWAAAPETVLPSGVKAVWDLEKAQRDKTPTRERVCLNGLWRWQPAKDAADAVPAGRLGLFQGARLLAGKRQLHPGGLPDALRPSELEGRRPAGPHRGLVSARDRPSPRTGPAAASPCGGVREFLRRRVRGRQEGGRDPVPGGRGGPHRRCAGPAASTSSVSSSSPCRSRASCSPTPTPTRPGK